MSPSGCTASFPGSEVVGQSFSEHVQLHSGERQRALVLVRGDQFRSNEPGSVDDGECAFAEYLASAGGVDLDRGSFIETKAEHLRVEQHGCNQSVESLTLLKVL